MGSEKRLIKKHEWRNLFTSKTLKEAEDIVDRGGVSQFANDESKAEAVIDDGKQLHRARIFKAPVAYSTEWDPENFNCTCKDTGYYYRTRYKPATCKHVAAALMHWEKKRGPWIFTENDLEYETRKGIEALEAEKERKRKIKEEEEKQKLSVRTFLDERTGEPGDTFFDIKRAVLANTTNLYEVHGADKILENKDAIIMSNPSLQYGHNGKSVLHVNAYVTDPNDRTEKTVEMTLGKQGLTKFWCSCQRYYGFYSSIDLLCMHRLAVLKRVYEYIEKNDPEDATDKAAKAFFSAIDSYGRSSVGTGSRSMSCLLGL